MSGRVLVLNSDYSPINICSLKRAVQLMLAYKVDVLEITGDEFCGASVKFDVPAVVRLKNYVKKPFRGVPMTRKNILTRDKNRCQYCGSKENLTIDHVIPRSRGGPSSWDNLVACCSKCNGKKGDKTPEEAGMPLTTKPRKPMHSLLLGTALDELWQDYVIAN